MTTDTEPAPAATTSKSDQVRALLQAGVAPGQIAKQVGCSRNLVYSIKAGGTGGKKRPTARAVTEPSAAAAGIDGDLDHIIRVVQQSQRETAALRDGLMRIADIVDELLR